MLIHYFEKNHELNNMLKSLDRINSNNFHMLQSHNAKCAHTMRVTNWNRSYFTFLGFFYQRGDIIQEDHICRHTTDENNLVAHNDTSIQWKKTCSNNDESNFSDHACWH